MTEQDRTVTLVATVQPSISIRLSASIGERGLVIEGQDVGPTVAAIWGDSDYEYWLTVRPEHLDRVATSLAVKLGEPDSPDGAVATDEFLLDLLERAWTRGVFETDVDFRQWLDEIGVPSEFASYA